MEVKKILITTGGTGGHVIPAEIIGDHLKDDYDILYSTDVRGLKYFKSHQDKTVILNTPKLNLDFFIFFKIIKSFFVTLQSLKFLKKNKISIVISTGGYMSLPVIVSARILNLKIFLIEPNLSLGRANKFFLNFSQKIFCYSKRLINFPKNFLHKIEIINPLVSKEFYVVKKKNNIDGHFNILISGGSQGAKFFDDTIKQVLSDLSQNHPIKVIQQTNIENIENLKKFYDSKKIKNEIFNFEKNFINLINKSDLCITRAGATSLAEISIMHKPFIAIPLPNAKDDHQKKNAEYYEELGCCWLLDQKNFNNEKLFEILSNIFKNNSDFLSKKKNLEKINYQNSWNDVNQKIKKIINEN